MSQNNYSEGLGLYHQCDYEGAIAQLELFRNDASLIGRLGRFYLGASYRGAGLEALQQRQWGHAESYFHQAMSLMGKHAELSEYLAGLYAGKGQYRRCSEAMEKCVDSEEDNPSLWRRCALAQWRAGRRPEAYLTLNQAMRKFPGISELHLQLGQFYAAEEDFVQARQSLARAVKADGVNAQAHYHLGLTCAAMGEYADAAKSLQRAFQLRPEDLLLAYQLTLAVRAAGSKGIFITIQLPESKPAFTEGSQIRHLANYLCREPEMVEAYLSLPESEEDSVIFGLLAGILQTAIDEHLNYADLHYYLSEVYARLGQKEPSLSEAQTALKLNPRYVQALVQMGKLCAQEGQRSKAIHYLQQAIACGGDFADVHCMVGELMQQIHRVEQARRHLKRALALNSNYTRAAEVLNTLAA